MITNQTSLFLIFIVNGILIGLLFDFFRILRKVFKTNDFVTYIEDILFWLLTGFIILYSIFVFNNGEIRLYLFLGIILGIILYILFVSSYVIKVNVCIINSMKKTIGFICGIILIPLKGLFKIIKKIFLKPISFFIINIRKISTNYVKTFYNSCKNINKLKNTTKK